MKRYLRMVLPGMLVLGMAATALAQVQVTGQVRARLRYWVNLDLDSNQRTADDRRYFDNRTRLGADAKLAEGVRARIELEKYWDYGNAAPNGTTSNQVGGATALTSTLGTPTDTPIEPYFRQAWMDFQIPGLPEGWRTQLGRSFFSVGFQQVWGNSLTGEDGITVYGPLGPGNLKLRFAVPVNQSETRSGRILLGDNEANYFAADYRFEVAPKQNIEVYGIYGMDHAADNYSTLVKGPGGTPVDRADEGWVGLVYDGAIGPVALKFEGVYQFGTARQDVFATTNGTVINGDIDRSAYFGYVDATYKIIPEWSVGLEASYATGDDNDSDDDYNNFVGPLAGVPASPTRVWTDSEFFFGNNTARRLGNITTNRSYDYWGRGTLDTDAERLLTIDNDGNFFSPGLIELKFYTTYAFSPKVSGKLNVIPTWADRNPTGISKYMGTEIDVQVDYKPYPNIVLIMYGGYFVTGGFFDQEGALQAARQAAGIDAVTDNAWMFRAEAVVTF